jgi:predicted CoA-binding protein
MNVAILGASAKKDRYSYRAFLSLKDKGHKVFPVNPVLKDIEGHQVYPSLAALPEPVDTITVYLAPYRSEPLTQDIIDAKPRRVIFNPGAENPGMMEKLEENGIEVVAGCTLVMLSIGNF